MTRRATFRETDVVRLTRAAQKAGAPKVEYVYDTGERLIVHTAPDSPLSTPPKASIHHGPPLTTPEQALREIEGWQR